MTTYEYLWAQHKHGAYLSRGLRLLLRVIGTNDEDLPITTRAAHAIVQNTAWCDAFIGSGFSTTAVTASAVNTKMWVGTATSTELSDKSAHPLFSRVFPSTASDAGAVISVLWDLGVTAAHIMCSDDVFGRSGADGFARAARYVGMTILSTSCVLTSATEADVRPVVEGIAARLGESEWVLSAVPPGPREVISQVVHSLGLNTSIRFASTRCPFVRYPTWLCTAFDVDPDHSATILQLRANRTASEVLNYTAQLKAAGLTDQQAAGQYRNQTPVTLATDAVEMAAEAFLSYRTQHPALPVNDYTALGLTANMRANVSITGGAGPMRMDAKGDRVAVAYKVVMYYPNGSTVDVGKLRNGTVTLTAPMYVEGVGFIPQRPLPTSTQPRPRTTSEGSLALPVWAIVVIVCVVGFIGVGVLVAFVVMTLHGRDTRRAPKDPSRPFTVVFTDIQSSTVLWSRLPALMDGAIDAHHTIIRRCIAAHNGYEVKTIGDSFMVAFKDPVDAVLFGLAVQTAFAEHDWGSTDIDDTYTELALRALELQHPDRAQRLASFPPGTWCGLRIRVGIATGLGRVELDTTTKGYDYYGTVVNTASRLEGIGHGGQVLVTDATHQHVLSQQKESEIAAIARIDDLGPQPLRGLDEPVSLMLYRAIRPAAIARRRYPPLRLHVEHDVLSLETSLTVNRSGKGRLRALNVLGAATPGSGPSSAASSPRPEKVRSLSLSLR